MEDSFRNVEDIEDEAKSGNPLSDGNALNLLAAIGPEVTQGRSTGNESGVTAAASSDTTSSTRVPAPEAQEWHAEAHENSDVLMVADNTRTRPEDMRGTLTVRFGDANMDKILEQAQAGKYDTVRIGGLPKDAQFVAGMTDSGQVFLLFGSNNQYNSKKFYIPDSVSTLIVDQEVNARGQIQSSKFLTDSFRADVIQARLDKANIPSAGDLRDPRRSPEQFAAGLANVATGVLDAQERFLRQEANNSPDNPYFRLYLADILFAKALKPVIDDLRASATDPSRKTVTVRNSLEITKGIDAALNELNEAKKICGQNGYHPNLDAPSGPRPWLAYHSNRDLYWSAAAYNAYRNEVAMKAIRYVISTGALNKLELP